MERSTEISENSTSIGHDRNFQEQQNRRSYKAQSEIKTCVGEAVVGRVVDTTDALSGCFEDKLQPKNVGLSCANSGSLWQTFLML